MINNITFYRECDEVLTILMTTDYRIFKNELIDKYPENAIRIIQEFHDQGFIREDRILNCIEIDRAAARPLFNRRYYQLLADKAEEDKKRDDLSERSTISAEESAKWAKLSSEAADKSVDISRKSNWIAIAAIVVSTLVALFQFVNCSPNILLLFKHI